MTLAWDPSPDASVVAYRLYYGTASRNYSSVLNVENATTATVSNLTAGLTYYFAVTAYDASGLESDFSDEVIETLPSPAPPATNLTFTTVGLSRSAPGSLRLAWNPSPDTNAVGYRLLYGTTSGTYESVVDLGNATAAAISGLTNGTTYFLVLSAYKADGQLCGFSAESSYTLPALSRLWLIIDSDRRVVLKGAGHIGHSYDILAAQTQTDWTVIGRVTVGENGSFKLVDPDASGLPIRLYRMREVEE